MIKINCVICDDEMENPRLNRVVCNKKECKKRYKVFLTKIWRDKNTNEIREYRNKYMKKYNKRDYVKKDIRKRGKAVSILKLRHRIELKEILKSLK